jgi:hypothetical protein
MVPYGKSFYGTLLLNFNLILSNKNTLNSVTFAWCWSKICEMANMYIEFLRHSNIAKSRRKAPWLEGLQCDHIRTKYKQVGPHAIDPSILNLL